MPATISFTDHQGGPGTYRHEHQRRQVCPVEDGLHGQGKSCSEAESGGEAVVPFFIGVRVRVRFARVLYRGMDPSRVLKTNSESRGESVADKKGRHDEEIDEKKVEGCMC